MDFHQCSHTFDIDLKNNDKLQFTIKAVSALMIVKSKYEDTRNVGILFDYWRRKGPNRNLTKVELQTKLTSILMTICSMKPAEKEGISLRHSVICGKPDKIEEITRRDRYKTETSTFLQTLSSNITSSNVSRRNVIKHIHRTCEKFKINK
ncbi:MAG: hypothetical protein EZS28_014693 [Streblomastix strix]|uniref:Uncharacterized protein n=1 Tax=Streblomastix strix TaxID=222440 RepID=A0A5J4W4L0_9EUKA|nr:MAG: hypothetical protein EZS28_014693 [Streblomastix strix]